MADKEKLMAKLEQCLTAHATLNDKVCALEDENDKLKKVIEIMASKSEDYEGDY